MGDPVFPAPTRTAVPALLGGAQIEVLAYPKSMVVAEKLVTALQRGRANTRWRDFADLRLLLDGELVEAEVLESLLAVAAHRRVLLRPLSDVLDGVPNDGQRQWAAWHERQKHDTRIPKQFETLVAELDAATRTWLEAAGNLQTPR